ncbi:Protein COBRA, partial [Cucurbita argyrosperma subsp. sororia]
MAVPIYRLPSLFALLAIFVAFSTFLASTEAYDPLDPNGNITVKWDVINWTPDGYVVSCGYSVQFPTISSYSSTGMVSAMEMGKERGHMEHVGGGQTTEQGDCSRYKGNIPHCCKRDPTVVDLLPGTPYNQQIANCCKGGVINSWVQDPVTAVSSFQLSVGAAGTSNKTVRLPKNFTLKAPGPGYTCGPAKIVKPSKFISADNGELHRP